MNALLIGDQQLEDEIARAYNWSTDFNALWVRVKDRRPNPHLQDDVCAPEHGGVHAWGTHPSWGPRYCRCGAYAGDRYHSSEQHESDPPETPCRFVQLADVYYSKNWAALVGLAECGAYVVWAD